MIYSKILMLCEKNNISVCQLEKVCGLGNGTIGKWEKTPKTVQSLQKIANHFGVTVDYLLK